MIDAGAVYNVLTCSLIDDSRSASEIRFAADPGGVNILVTLRDAEPGGVRGGSGGVPGGKDDIICFQS